VVTLGTPPSENVGEPDPHHRNVIEKADASAVLMVKNAAAQIAKRMRMLTSFENLYNLSKYDGGSLAEISVRRSATRWLHWVRTSAPMSDAMAVTRRRIAVLAA